MVGHEIRGARDFFGAERVLVVGGAGLTQRYVEALNALGIATDIGPADAAARGLWSISRQMPRPSATG